MRWLERLIALARGEKIVELARILDATRVDRRARVREPTGNRVCVAPQQLECLRKDRDDLLHALVMRETRHEMEQPAIDPVRGRLEGCVAVTKYGGAARQIFEQANLAIEQGAGHGR